MGACEAGYTSKVKVGSANERSALLKEFQAEIEQAQHEYGHGGYSGSVAEFHRLNITSHVFTSYDEAQAFIEPKEKGEAYAYQMKIADKNTLVDRWASDLSGKINQLYRMTRDTKEHKAQTKAIAKLAAKLATKRKELATKSKKSVWVIGGWVSE